VDNEQYLQVSYFVAAGAGIVAAVVTALVLRRANREATEAPSAAAWAGRLLRRGLPAWLILAVLAAFMSVSYFPARGCNEPSKTYSQIVADRDHLVQVTKTQASEMANQLAVALVDYGVVLGIFLWARARSIAGKPRFSPTPRRPTY